MLPSKTVFIIGAGASFEVGMPVGDKLKKIISEKLDLRFDTFDKLTGTGDREIFNVLRQKHGRQINQYLKTCLQVSDGVTLSPSIDDYINTHQHDDAIAECGKIAIAHSILEAERQSKLFYKKHNFRDTIDFKSISETWYPAFYQLLSQGVKKGDLEKIFNNVTIISFNYDRCIEHYLVHAITTHLQIRIEEARELVESLTIFHPYGSVGKYFGQQHEIVDFGSNRIPNINDVVRNLKTFTEKVADTESLNFIRHSIIDADVLVFLGNAYHPINTELLMDEEHPYSGSRKRIFATRKGISTADLTVVRRQLTKLCGVIHQERTLYIDDNYHFADTCSDLFAEYRMSLRQ